MPMASHVVPLVGRHDELRVLTGMEGVRVVVGARTPTAELSALVERAAVHPVWTDLATVDGPARLVDAAIATFGGLDILVNNVGAARPRTGGFLSVTDDDWMSTLTINFLSAVRVTRAALPHLLDRGAGSIITIASVNTVSPGPVSTDLWLGADGVAQTVAHAIGNDPHAVAKQAAGDAVTGRFTRPEEVADLVLLLASDRTANVTGADFVVDGGLINTL